MPGFRFVSSCPMGALTIGTNGLKVRAAATAVLVVAAHLLVVSSARGESRQAALETSWTAHMAKFDGGKSAPQPARFRGADPGRTLDRWIGADRIRQAEDRTKDPTRGELAHAGLVGVGLIAVGSTMKRSFWRDIGAVLLVGAAVVGFLLLL